MRNTPTIFDLHRDCSKEKQGGRVLIDPGDNLIVDTAVDPGENMSITVGHRQIGTIQDIISAGKYGNVSERFLMGTVSVLIEIPSRSFVRSVSHRRKIEADTHCALKSSPMFIGCNWQQNCGPRIPARICIRITHH